MGINFRPHILKSNKNKMEANLHEAQRISLERRLDTLKFQKETAPYDRALPQLIEHYEKAYKELTGRDYDYGNNRENTQAD